jgi:hypothetical protein
MDETYTGVDAESPTAPDDGFSQPDAPAAIDNRIPYDRFKQVIDERSAWQAQAAQAQAQAQQYAAMLQAVAQANRARQASPNLANLNEQERLAFAALQKLNAHDPNYQAIRQGLQQIQELRAHYQQMQAQQEALATQTQTSLVRQGQGQIGMLAQQSGLPTDVSYLNHVENNIAAIIKGNAEAHARWRQGDPTIVPWAFRVYQQEGIGPIARQSNAAVAYAKAQMRNLASPMRGGPPGAPLFPKPIPGQERAYTTDMHRAAASLMDYRG